MYPNNYSEECLKAHKAFIKSFLMFLIFIITIIFLTIISIVAPYEWHWGKTSLLCIISAICANYIFYPDLVNKRNLFAIAYDKFAKENGLKSFEEEFGSKIKKEKKDKKNDE